MTRRRLGVLCVAVVGLVAVLDVGLLLQGCAVLIVAPSLVAVLEGA